MIEIKYITWSKGDRLPAYTKAGAAARQVDRGLWSWASMWSQQENQEKNKLFPSEGQKWDS